MNTVETAVALSLVSLSLVDWGPHPWRRENAKERDRANEQFQLYELSTVVASVAVSKAACRLAEDHQENDKGSCRDAADWEGKLPGAVAEYRKACIKCGASAARCDDAIARVRRFGTVGFRATVCPY